MNRDDGMAARIIVGREMFIGLVIGHTASSVFWIAQSGGVIIDNMAGFNNIQTSNHFQALVQRGTLGAAPAPR